MHFSMIIKLCIYILLCQRVSSSGHLFSKNATFPKNCDNLLENFFVDLNKAYLQHHNTRHIVVVGPSINDLLQVQPLFELYPYIVCKGTETCVLPQQFCRGSFVIVFLEDLSRETIGRNIEILTPCKNCRILFVYNGNIQVAEIWSIFTFATRRNMPYSKLAHPRENVVELYGDYLAANCSMGVRLATVWKPVVGLGKIHAWSVRRDMKGCPVSVSSLTFTPKMLIKENENGSLTVAGGLEGELLLAIASELNFTINLRYPSVVNQMKYSRKVAVILDVTSGISEIGIGRLRPIRQYKTSVSFPYDTECITWAVPRILKWSDSIVSVEFSWQVWTCVGLVFITGCIVRYAFRNTMSSKNSKRNSLGLVTIIFDAVAIHLGNPIIYTSCSVGGRFMLIASLCYVTVITTAYKTSLASILSTHESTPWITNAQGIVDKNLKVGGSLYDYDILMDQINDSEVNSKLIDRFIINNNDAEIWNSLVLRRDWALLGRRTFQNYYRQDMLKDHEFATFNVLDDCVLCYPTVILFQAKSTLHKPANDIIRHLVESGIPKYWEVAHLDSDKLMKHRNMLNYTDKRGAYKFWNIFNLYSICIAISLFTFFMELITPKLNSRRR